jgi:hypothetical protein
MSSKKELEADYSRIICTLYDKVKPLLDEGWDKDKLFNFFVYIKEKNKSGKNKSFSQMKDDFLSEKETKY